MSTEKKSLICEKLLDLMEEQSFFSIKATAFIAYAGISRSTFYFYFDSLYDVLQMIEDEFMEGLLPESEIVETARAKQPTKLGASFISKVDYIERHKRTIRILTGENGDPSFVPRLINRNKRINREGLRGSSKLDADGIELMAEYMAAGQVQALKWWAASEDGMELCDVLRALERNTIALYKSVE